jgi:chaperonin cofactor prefoldin
MSPLDIKKIQVELKRVDAAKEEMELRVQERMEEIQRLEDNIKIQVTKIAELQAKLADANKA